MKKFIKLIQILIIFMLVFVPTIYIKAQNNAPYLGQTPPDTVAVRFGDSNYLASSQWWWHGSPAFSPDGKEMYFSKYIATGGIEIWFTKYENNQWTIPARASFSIAGALDNNPIFKGNDTLYFYSSRSNYYKFIYRITRSNNSAWSAPVGILLQVPSQYYSGSQFAISRNGNIYAELEAPPYNNRDLYFYKLKANGQYEAPQKINSLCTDSIEFTPYVDPDEKYIIFCSGRAGGYSRLDLYVSYKNQYGTWETPQNMGAEINSTFATFPNVSPDGEYLFFNTKRDNDTSVNAYWLKIDKFFTSLNLEDKKKLKNEIEVVNFPNPCKTETIISFELTKQQSITIELFNSNGNKVNEIITNKTYPKGKHEIKFDVSKFENGTYFYSIVLENGEKISKKILVIK